MPTHLTDAFVHLDQKLESCGDVILGTAIRMHTVK
jgi:hypothetical protein